MAKLQKQTKETKTAFEAAAEKILPLIERMLAGEIEPKFKSPFASSKGKPQNVDGREYRGGNALILGLVQWLVGYSDCRWITYNRASKMAQEQGDKIGVKKGEKGIGIVVWNTWQKKEIIDGEEVVTEIPYARGFVVFNVQQTDLDFPAIEGTVNNYHNPFETAEKVIANMPNKPAMTRFAGEASYTPTTDIVNVPPMEHFKNLAGYYGTTFHELVHATKHETRLNRKYSEGKDFTANYSTEELVAEIGSSMVLQTLGIIDDEEVFNSASYLTYFLNVLKADARALYTVAKHAQAAHDYILNLNNTVSTDDETTPEA